MRWSWSYAFILVICSYDSFHVKQRRWHDGADTGSQPNAEPGSKSCTKSESDANSQPNSEP
jgi:hypothetical protein